MTVPMEMMEITVPMEMMEMTVPMEVMEMTVQTVRKVRPKMTEPTEMPKTATPVKTRLMRSSRNLLRTGS